MGIIDTHSHIYLEQFDSDRDEMIQRASETGVDMILMPNVDVATIQPMLDVEQKFPLKCKSMMGLHPTSVDLDYKKQLEIMYPFFAKNDFCAVGEIGIDLYWDKTYLEQQIEAFEIQLNWAKEFNLPVVIHARDAFDEIFSVLDNFDTDSISGVFHSFTGNIQQGKKILDYKNFYLGINGVVTFKNSGLDKVVSELGYDKLVLETDAPYLTPTPFRGKRNEPSYLSYVIEKLSALFEVSKHTIIKQTTSNADKLFKL